MKSMVMGLDASVMCNCFERGLTSEPPFPRDWLHVDEEGYLNLKPEHDSSERWHLLWEWQRNCCEHEGMNYCSHRISNWYGYRLFQAALQNAGAELFPMLVEELPDLNGGLTESRAAASCLRELATFREKGVIGTKTVLVDTNADVVIREFVAVYEGVFILAGSAGLHFGLTEFEFYIRDAETGELLFTATRFQQSVQGKKPSGESGERVLYTDLDSGATFECSVAVSGQQIPWDDGSLQNDEGRVRFDYPIELHVEPRESLADDFDYVVTPLENVFRASTITGNPVRWC
ncbi:MAG: hypothetical protein R3C10_07060 [Pirellulales bacterium]